MQLDGAGDVGLGAGLFRVIAAHQALQFGEFADHAGDEVGLGQFGRTAGVLRVGVDCSRDLERQFLDAFHPILLGAEFFVKRDAGQFIGHFVEGLLEILLPEELGIRQSRANDLFVAGDDRGAAVGGRQVGNEQEPVGEFLRLGIAQGEALLVLLHGGCQNLAGNLQEFRVEGSHENHGPLGKAGVFRHEGVVFDEMQLGRFRRGMGRFSDRRHARGGIEHHLVGRQLGDVVVEGFHLEWGIAVEAVTARGIAAGDAGDFEWHDLAVEQADDGM